ncbi:hypothetical protein [Thalassospira alkalitolerans]|uniref:hypothetical protein n=1 Tax=Thalassospira alkalitolerans TaxID=1293890 RepID=UPI003AA7EBD7
MLDDRLSDEDIADARVLRLAWTRNTNIANSHLGPCNKVLVVLRVAGFLLWLTPRFDPDGRVIVMLSTYTPDTAVPFPSDCAREVGHKKLSKCFLKERLLMATVDRW